MKSAKILKFETIYLLLSFFFSVNAQTTGISNQIIISETPTVDELTKEFTLVTEGKHELFAVLLKITSKKDKAVPALSAYLFTQPKSNPGQNSNPEQKIIPEPSRLFAVFALEAIATPSAYNVLIKAASTHFDKEVRGVSISSFANNCYNRTKNNNTFLPDKEVIHIFMVNADDTTYISHCGRRIGEIAREGLKNWTGEDYGELTTANNQKGFTINAVPPDREKWWQSIGSNYIWNKNKNKFEIKK